MLSDCGYSFLTVTKFDDERRTFSGIATTPRMDRDGDVIEPLGITFSDTVKLLLHHDTTKPVGNVRFFPPTAEGVRFEATIPKITEPGPVKDRADEAWQSVKHRLLTAVSVRVRAMRDHVKKLSTGGLHWMKSEITELSLVAIPSNTDARIEVVRSLDIGRPAATGIEVADVDNKPRNRGVVRVLEPKASRQDVSMKTYTERIKDFENTRAAKVAEREQIQNTASEAGRSKDETEREQFNQLTEDIKSIDSELIDLRTMEESAASTAKLVDGTDAKKASASRDTRSSIITVKSDDEREPGIRFTRFAMAIAASKGNYMAAEQMARARWPEDSQMHEVLKAAVAAGTTADATWAGNLVQYTNLQNPFFELLQAETILGKFGQNGVPALNKIGFKTRTFTETVAGDAYWVQEGKPKPLTKFGFGTVTLDFHKLATITVLTQEEVRFSSPSAEVRVRNRLIKAVAKRADLDFVDPSNAGTANTKPASITNGIAALTPSGTTPAALQTDIATLLGTFMTNNYDPTNIVLIMSGTTALAASLMRNTLGNRSFPDMTVRGGNLSGIPVIVSQHLAGLGSPSTGMIIAVSADDILLADDGQTTIDASDQASLEMLDSSLTQDGAAGTGASLVSLWQNNLLGLKAERFITWKLARATAVAYLSPVAYVA